MLVKILVNIFWLAESGLRRTPADGTGKRASDQVITDAGITSA
jgi:hypothetical protein